MKDRKKPVAEDIPPDCAESENAAAMQRAQDAFTRECGAELAENCNRLIIEVATRYRRIKDGQPPSALGGFDRDEIARILAADTAIRYDGYVHDTADSGGWVATTWETDAIESWDRRKFIEVLDGYLAAEVGFADAHRAAAACAGYGEARRIIGAAACPLRGFAPIPPDDALRVVELERKATECLLAGMEAAK